MITINGKDRFCGHLFLNIFQTSGEGLKIDYKD